MAPRPEVPTAGRPIDREKILERYKRTPAAIEKDARDVKEARDAERAKQAEDVKARRDEHRADQARREDNLRDAKAAREVKSARDLYRAEQRDKLERRQVQQAAARTKRLRDEYASTASGNSSSWKTGQCVSKFNGYGLYLGFGLGMSCCNPYGWYSAGGCWPWWYWNGWDECGSYWYGWCHGAYSYSWCSHPFSWTYRWWYGCWPRYSYWWPSYYARYYYAPPLYYSSYLAGYDDSPDVVIYADGGDDVVVVSGGGRVVVREGEGASEPAQAGESVQGAGSGVDPAVAGVLGRGPDTLSRLATQYLADGDAAFRERRYGDAAHFYAKAIEYRPDEGVLYLVLSDALFATGDYHYGAFALRRALELDPSLATSDLDKHEFYSDPTEFDRQLQVLERFLADHVTDVDARILLAANYLFSRKPELTVDLLEAGTSEAARNDSAGKLLLASAKHSLARKP